ncbi:MAG TPA: tryptophan synthase subunit alpha [Candidatus Saccharimonadales bacterium]|nr:tryptophan synthase subunit alpha [Candidatus Saccharimonadales bacterium]
MTVTETGVDRIGRAFARAKAERRIAVAIYLTVGYPRPSATSALLEAALDGGADVLELGVPFSDPLADGATVQRASQAALEQGTTLRECIAQARSIVRDRDATVVLMGYANPFIHHGLPAFARDAAEAGIAGVIVPDLPFEESAEFDAVLAPAGLARIDLYAPTTPDARLDRLLPGARGFVYCVSLTGVTGARAVVAGDAGAFVARVRSRTALPIVLGFGISTAAHVAALRGIVDGVAVGSAALDVVTASGDDGPARLRDFVQGLVAAGRQE